MMHVNGLSNVPSSKATPPKDNSQLLQEIWPQLLQEARAVSLWSCVTVMCRIALILLVTLAAYRHDSTALRFIPFLQEEQSSSSSSSSSSLYKEVWMTISVLCGWILGVAPSKILTQQAPGFIFANPWVLLWVRDKTGIIPNIPVRACEYMMGRISLVELVAMLPIHFVTIVSTSIFLQRIFPDHLTSLALEPISYSNKENPWFVDLCREVLITAVFTIGVLVLPVLFRLNYVPRWATTFALYPAFNFAVDGVGMASSFTPNVVLALALLGRRSLPTGFRFIASILGGLVGGKVMQRYFPDDPRVE